MGRTLKRRRGHGWHGGCPAGDMPAVAVASLAWFGEFSFRIFVMKILSSMLSR
jgi:hypothetical protein